MHNNGLYLPIQYFLIKFPKFDLESHHIYAQTKGFCFKCICKCKNFAHQMIYCWYTWVVYTFTTDKCCFLIQSINCKLEQKDDRGTSNNTNTGRTNKMSVTNMHFYVILISLWQICIYTNLNSAQDIIYKRVRFKIIYTT